jgi:hypothetical protein
MKQTLPDYDPPNTQRADLAMALAPMFVLLGFVLIVTRLIDPDTGLAGFFACTVWVVHEMSAYQKSIDGYNARYAASHLSWRSVDSLEALAQAEDTSPATRDFLRRFVNAGQMLLRDGQSV